MTTIKHDVLKTGICRNQDAFARHQQLSVSDVTIASTDDRRTLIDVDRMRIWLRHVTVKVGCQNVFVIITHDNDDVVGQLGTLVGWLGQLQGTRHRSDCSGWCLTIIIVISLRVRGLSVEGIFGNIFSRGDAVEVYVDHVGKRAERTDRQLRILLTASHSQISMSVLRTNQLDTLTHFLFFIREIVPGKRERLCQFIFARTHQLCIDVI